nr:DUF418 domain-containing protein [Cytophagales bacterium]
MSSPVVSTVYPSPDSKIISARIHVIDALRGVVLLGILLIHSFNDYRFVFESAFEFQPQDRTYNLARAIMSNLFSNLLYTIFSFLFGVSVAIQLENARSKGRSFVGVYLWRLCVLLLIGFIHSIWFPRDILQLYAILGMLLLFFSGLSPRRLLLAAAMVLGVGLGILYFQNVLILPVNELGEWSRESTILRSLGFSKIDYLILSGRICIIFCLFMLGLYAGKSGLLKYPHKHRLFFGKLLVMSFMATLFIGIISNLLDESGKLSFETASVLDILKRLAQSAFYVSLIITLYEFAFFRSIIKPFIPLGKMGLSIYVTQSLFLVYYYSLDPAFIRSMGLMGALSATIGYFIVQTAFAWAWLSVFRYGPLEWVWRSITYLKVFPLRKDSA